MCEAGWLNLGIGSRDSCVCLCLVLCTCSSVLYLFLFSFSFLPYPFPFRDEVMQRGEQLFIPPPPPTIRVCDEKTGEDKEKNYTFAHHHSEVKPPSSSSSSIHKPTHFSSLFFETCLLFGLFYNHLNPKNTTFLFLIFFYFSIFNLLLLYSTFWGGQCGVYIW